MWLKWESGHIGHKIKKGEMELQGRRKSRSQKQHMSSESGLAHSPDEISLMEEKNIFSEHQEFLYAGQLYTEHLDINPSEEKQI